jgi:hypothetical protein
MKSPESQWAAVRNDFLTRGFPHVHNRQETHCPPPWSQLQGFISVMIPTEERTV